MITALAIWLGMIVVYVTIVMFAILLIGGFCWCLAFLVGYIRAIIKLRRRE